MWEIIKTSLPQLLAAGFKYTIPLAIISFFFGLIIALVTALIRLSRQRGAFMILKWIASFYVWLFRSTPLLVQLFIVFFGLPYLRIKGVLPHGIKLEPFTAGIITFSLNTGAYASETIRAAISSVPTGQWEAGAAIGMTRLQILWRIILPQALRVALPPLSNSFISLVKDTSLAASITIMEMFAVSQQIAAENYQPLLMYTLVAMVYAAFTTILSYFQGYLERVVDRQVNANNR
ncbi:amino acid ABC transporter permease [Limosilactobacillus reuteri]|jgi:cystine transport system permease protein|uniref:Amino acid ABC transporter permease n=3 Tax=Limosilactobacillus reuteri TaxID=1598 RepID=A0A1V4FNA4_LIMRT|nr:amino acid ABC transporter permease [Limosilactobacillus reuteri]CCC04177.1 ABC transporter permease component [Limosilactobacillus reuteri subsp. suis]AGN99854.1 ABC transporter permease component [Limosilactobacillus reuteri I5007]AMY13828.1 cysteine ABC transporter permease [Limosilactobacillus reuteri]MCC4339505.1 amino acid ABC transporter permease [Limosilactobacillus reuteri]MCC4346311.1 amino acid ABC transporter permease [Limosilactobacillus reuteri]